eukprot:CAMPEP_0197498978 /NCGR_PEP_ID=MMETSP1311-20131121/60789_1 /TAXON_ID=464262 /ORGANISM="Genus nov. species nov., Strain RCC856" /LENGTH=293 /DNA_ID=CAMNT_0043044717 /DNA_START=106 /DNA_END=987 /DNA_ORIENTATION=+
MAAEGLDEVPLTSGPALRDSLFKWAAFYPGFSSFALDSVNDFVNGLRGLDIADDFGIDDETSATVADQDGEPLIMLDLSQEVEYGELLEFDSDEFDLDEEFDYGEPLVAEVVLFGGGTGTQICYSNDPCPYNIRRNRNTNLEHKFATVTTRPVHVGSLSLGEAQGPIQTDFPYGDLWGQRRGTPGDLGARREWPKLDQWVDQDLGDGLVEDQDENESENAVGSREATDQVARVTELVEDFAPVQPPQMRGDIRPQNALLGASNSQTIRLMWIKWMLYTGLVEFNFPGLAGRGR